MILIAKATINTVVLTLTEKSTLSSPNYLFVFKNDSTKQNVYFIAQDISSYSYRYNKFLIEESNAETPLTGKIKLNPTGFWHYEIWEQSSSTNLDPANATGIVETGKVKVVTTADENDVYDLQTKTNVVYEG